MYMPLYQMSTENDPSAQKPAGTLVVFILK